MVHNFDTADLCLLLYSKKNINKVFNSSRAYISQFTGQSKRSQNHTKKYIKYENIHTLDGKTNSH